MGLGVKDMCMRILISRSALLSSFCVSAWKSRISNGSGWFPAISPLDALMRLNREKRFIGGHWLRCITAAHVSAGAKTS